jgi:hypothetical protein
MKKDIISDVMRAMGKKGGKASLKTMTKDERIARAKKAVAAREAKRGRK